MPDRGIPRKFEQKLRLVSYGKRQQEPPPLANFWRKGWKGKSKDGDLSLVTGAKPDIYIIRVQSQEIRYVLPSRDIVARTCEV